MNESRTVLQKLDDEYRDLEKLRSEIDDEVNRLCGDDEAKASWTDKRRIDQLRQRFDEAGARRDHIEEFAMICNPRCRDDAYILLRLAVAVASDHRGDRFETYQRNMLLPRMIAEAGAY